MKGERKESGRDGIASAATMTKLYADAIARVLIVAYVVVGVRTKAGVRAR